MTDSFLRTLLAGAAAPPIRSAADLRLWRAGSVRGADTVEQAALSGTSAETMGWAFAAGYQAAVARLDQDGMEGGVLGALCATEEGGGHPKAIHTTLTEAGGSFVLTGSKTWVTLGADADRLLVVASVGADEEGRNRLRVVRVPADRAGVALLPGTQLPFVPEIAHARVTFDEVAIAAGEVLPGDGYDDALKPFRTIEDVHVTAGVLGWALRAARASGWERAWIDEAASASLMLRSLGRASPSAPETHVALAGALTVVRRLLDRGGWSKCPDAVRVTWERDRRVLDVASNVRAARLEAAWRALVRTDDLASGHFPVRG